MKLGEYTLPCQAELRDHLFALLEALGLSDEHAPLSVTFTGHALGNSDEYVAMGAHGQKAIVSVQANVPKCGDMGHFPVMTVDGMVAIESLHAEIDDSGSWERVSDGLPSMYSRLRGNE